MRSSISFSQAVAGAAWPRCQRWVGPLDSHTFISLLGSTSPLPRAITAAS